MNLRGFLKPWRKVVGILLIGAGVVGLFLPFLQGIAMIFAGIALWDSHLYKKLILSVKSFRASQKPLWPWKRPEKKSFSKEADDHAKRRIF